MGYEQDYAIAKERYAELGVDTDAVLKRMEGIALSLHCHDFSELVLIISGAAEHLTEWGTHPVRGGDIFLIREGMAHGYKSIDDLVLINILFDEDSLGLPFQDLRDLPGYHTLFSIEPAFRRQDEFTSRLHVSPSHMDRILDCAEALEEELREKRPGYVFGAKAKFMELITRIARSYPEIGETGGEKRYRLGEAMTYIEGNLDRNISIGELLAITGYSESTLLRAFKRVTGDSPLHYQRHLRIARAKRLLEEPSTSITQVAYDSGFADSNYFSRVFRGVTGLSPRDYRKSRLRSSPLSPGKGVHRTNSS